MCLCQSQMVEKMTVRGSHGESSLQRESDSFGFYRTVSQQQSGAHPEDRHKQEHSDNKTKQK